MKAPTSKVHVEKGRPSGQSKNTPVETHPEKDNTSPTATKVTQNGKLPPKNTKTGMFTMPYTVYNIDYNIVDDLKKSRANITYFDLLKLTRQRDLLLKAIMSGTAKFPPSQEAKPRSQCPNLSTPPL